MHIWQMLFPIFSLCMVTSCCYYYCHCYHYPGLAHREEQGEQWAEPAAQHASGSPTASQRGAKSEVAT